MRPAPVREILVDLKDLCELAIDLAYSAYLFHSPDLAQEVLEIEEHAGDLLLNLEMALMLAARRPEDAMALVPVSRVGSSIARIIDAAADIAKMVVRGAGLHPAIREAFAHTKERLVRVLVAEGSELANKKAGELEPWVEVIAVKRNGDWILNPEDDELLLPGDVIIARGSPEEVRELVELAEEPSKAVGVPESDEHVVRLAELLTELKESSELAIDLAYTALLLNSPELAREAERLEEYVDELHADLQVAVLASKFNVVEVEDILALLRIAFLGEEIADAAAEMARVMLRGLEPHPVIKMAIEESDERVAIVEVAPSSPLVGKALAEARIPEETGMWIVAMRRGGRLFRPKGATLIKPGDVLIAVGYAEGEKDLAELAGGGASSGETGSW